MFTPLAVKVFSKGCTLPKAATRIRRPIKSFFVHRPYSQKHEDLIKDAQQLHKDLKAIPNTGINFKKAFARESDGMKASYNEFYNYFATNPAKDEWPSGFYDLPEANQKALRELYATEQALYTPILTKYGDDSNPGWGRISAIFETYNAPFGEPLRVAITGAAGAIGYALAYRIASGGLFGPKTPVILHLLELPQALNSLKGVEMELLDCAFPTLKSVVITDQPDKAFEGVDYALLVGALPRMKGMERGDLLLKNAAIFATQGKSLNDVSKGADTRVVVVGNPANTNALIASHHAKSIPRENFIAMTRLDHNRGLAKIAEKAQVHVDDISRFIIWGNHSTTQFPDLSHTVINNELALDIIKDDTWVRNVFIPGVQQRGAEIINARGASSAASAASSALDTAHDWHFGTNTKWMSAAVHSNGEYGITPGLYYSYPVVFNDQRHWDIVRDLPIDQFAAEKMEATHKELLQERDGVTQYLA